MRALGMYVSGGSPDKKRPRLTDAKMTFRKLSRAAHSWVACFLISTLSVTSATHAEVRIRSSTDNPRVSIAPVLRYDANINGGQPRSSFDVGGIVFQVAPSDVAQQGVLAGASLSLDGLSEFGSNFGIKYQLNLQALTDLKARHGVQQSAVSVCGMTFLSDSNLVSFCASNSEERKDLSRSSLSSFEARSEIRNRLMTYGREHPDWETSVALALGRDSVDGRWRNKVSSSFGLHGTGGRNAQFAVSFFEPISGALSDRYRVSASLEDSKYFLSGLNFTYTHAAGGSFFGLDRYESTIRVGVNIRASKNFTASIGYTQKDSSVDFYDAAGSIDFIMQSMNF
jgi:hypothetical protein